MAVTKYLRLQFFLLPGPTDKTPKASQEIRLLEAGLGKRALTIEEDAGHEEIVRQLEDVYPKLKNLSGGWLFYKASGGSGQRNLSVVPTESEGYTGRTLKAVTSNGKYLLYIAPLQEDINTSPLPHDAPEFSKMPKAVCKNCGVTMPLQFLALHIETCEVFEFDGELDLICVDDKQTKNSGNLARNGNVDTCPICEQQFPKDVIVHHASLCGERKKLLEEQERQRPLCFFVDLHDSVVDRNKSIVSFYKAPKVNWASPLHCTLEGDAAIGDGVNRHFISMSICALQRGFHMNYGNTDVTLLFEGQPDHLVPCTSQVLVDSDLFLVAGRMVGHAFLHGGPALSGISSAVVDVLFGASPETTTITLEDCPDIDQRLTISLLKGEKELSDEDKAAVWALADVWDLPGVTQQNRRWLFNRLL
ncbi:hypothetical protein UPYG_G00110430 [Umbra pygmaea]|uniref:Uncharacterized protein n=1 Tax=Umbra pygmaea TaxID=75934 RepID=A0ABD0XKD6_UMBPY